MKPILFVAPFAVAMVLVGCQISSQQAVETASLSHPWHDSSADGGLNAGPAPGESSSIGMGTGTGGQ